MARLKAELHKLELAEKLQFYLAVSPTVTYVLRVAGETFEPVWASDNIQRVLGFTAEEYLQSNWWVEHLHPGHREQVLANQALILEEGSHTQEYQFLCKDKSVLWVRDSLRLVWNENENLQEIIGSWTDITDLKQKEEKERQDITARMQMVESLEESERFLRESQEAAGIGSYIVDISSGAWKSSGLLCEIFGIDKVDNILIEEWASLIHPDWQESILQIVREVIERCSEFNKEYKIIKRNSGEERWIHHIGKLESDEKGKPIRLIGTILDITERKLREEEICTRNNELTALFDLSTHLCTAINTAVLIPVLLDDIRNLVQADGSIITVLSDDGMYFNVTSGEGLWKDSIGMNFPADQGLSGVVLRTGKPYLSENYSAETQNPLPHADEVGPYVCVPMLQENEKIIGLLSVARRSAPDTRPFTPAQLCLLASIGEMAGSALRRLRLYESTQKHLKQIQTLRNIDMAIIASLDLRGTFKVILDEITSQLGLDAAAILRCELSHQTLKYEAWRGFRTGIPKHTNFRLGEGYAGRAALTRQSIQIPELHKVEQDPDQGPFLAEEGFAAYYAVPLIAKGLLQGVLEVYHRKQFNSHDGDWLEFLETLAGQTAIAINNAELFQNLERSNTELIQAYDDTIEGWAHALDLRDQETGNHSQRVAKMTVDIAIQMGMKEEKLAHVRRGASLHDIGKMGIPDTILLKTGKLTDEEWEIMHRHPRYAYEMLTPIEYLRPALDIPYCHHEKWDGTGYPQGLKGERIPLAARIFAVVDVFDALTSERPYRKAWTSEKALEHIRRQSGKHFDSQVVELFLKEREISE